MKRKYGFLEDQVRPKVKPFSGRRAEYPVLSRESKKIPKKWFNEPVSFLLDENFQAYDIRLEPGYHMRHRDIIVKRKPFKG